MKRLTRVVILLYPPAWRQRYRAELEALIEDSGSGWRVIGDLLKESMKMQLKHWSFGKMAGALGLAGLIIGATMSAWLPQTYISNAEMAIVPPAESIHRPISEYLLQMENRILSRTSLATIIQDPNLELYASERKSTPLEDVIEEMRTRDIRVHLDSPSTFSISFRYPDKLKARRTVQALITKFFEDSRLRRFRVETEYGRLEVLDPSSFPSNSRIPFLPSDWQDLLPGWLRPTYTSQAELRMTPAAPERTAQVIARLELYKGEILSRTSLSSIIQGPLDLYAQERKSTPLEDVIEKMKKDIRIQPASTDPLTFTVAFHYPDRRRANEAVQVLISRFMDANITAQRQGETTVVREIAALSVLDPPSLPVAPARPNRIMIAFLGLGSGILLAAVLKLLLKLRPVIAA